MDVKLTDNKHIAKRVLASQIKLASKSEDLKGALIKSHDKLETRGLVVAVADLSADMQKAVLAKVIPWRHVMKLESLTTPVWLVFDASSRTLVANL